MIKKFNVEKTKQLDKVDKLLSFFYRKPVANSKKKFTEVENILIIDFALMGDMIMNIPFLRTLKRNCPKAKITMVCMSWGEIILGKQGLVDDFIFFDGKNKLSTPRNILLHLPEIKKVIKKINLKSYELGFEPKGDLRHTLLLHYTNCDRSISYNYTGGSFLITDSLDPKIETEHLIDEKMDLLELIGMKVWEEDKLPELILNDNDFIFLNRFKKENGLDGKYLIGLHPGASNSNKQYKHYPELIEMIKNSINSSTVFLVFEGPGESEIVDSVCAKMDCLSIDYLRIRESIDIYIRIVSLCDIMICNDSAAGHFAAAYNINTIVVFGPVDHRTAIPRGNCKIIAISHELACKPCTMPVCPINNNNCIESIAPVEIYEGVLLMLSNNI